MDAQQSEFESFAVACASTVCVSDHVFIRTEGAHRVISVHGVLFAQYERGEHAAEAYTMVALCEAGYATQKQVARAFGYAARSVRRYQERFAAQGIAALARMAGRPAGARSRRLRSPQDRQRDRTLLHWKAQGRSNRDIAGKFGVSEKAIRKRLRRLGWQAVVSQPSLTLTSVTEERESASAQAQEQQDTCAPEEPERQSLEPSSAVDTESAPSWDHDPLDRSNDRALAAMGLLEDAAPLFARAENLPKAGVLLAIPALRASAVLSIARQLYGNIAPAFYGLRTTLVAFILLSLLRIPRPEHLKEYVPQELGRIIGLDRILEVKTLRRKLARLASHRQGQNLGRELAQRRIAERGRMMGFLYIDGHVRTYHGQRRIAKGYDTRRRLAVPATTDYWVNDQGGDPLLVVTAEANAAMTRMLEPLLKEIRALLKDQRRLTVVFDRGGWSPQLFVKLLAMNFDILTYRKGRCAPIAQENFHLRSAELDGRPVEYLLCDQPVELLKGKLRLRQITRLKDGHQTAILTSRFDLSDLEVAYRMFDRWRQENFFKYLREEYLIDGLVDYSLDPDDPQRSVPNPARQTVDRALRQARAQIKKLQEAYGAAALEHFQKGTATLKELEAEQQKIHSQLQQALAQVNRLREQQQALPTRIPLGQVRPHEEPIKLSTERKHLTNVLKLVAYQIESDLVNLIRPHYARTEEEGRTLIQTALQSAASLQPTATELHVTLHPLSSAHRSRAIDALCKELNHTETCFPGTALRLRFAVAQAAAAGNDPKADRLTKG